MSFTNVVLVKVGTADRPATKEDIDDIIRTIRLVKNDKDLDIVTHHAIKFETVRVYGDGVATVWKLGDADRPATDEDIEGFKAELTSAKEEKRPIVWHHAVTVEYISLSQ